MHKRLTQLKALSGEEWRILLSALTLLPLIALALHLKGFKWAQSCLQARLQARAKKRAEKINSSSAPINMQQAEAQSLARMVTLAANYGPYRANCLKRSLVTWYLLQDRGIAAQLIIGVDKKMSEFKAHAWVEYAGVPLIEAKDVATRYTTFGPQ